MENVVSHYGIHWTDDHVAFLQQGRSAANAVGLKKRSPFRVELKNKRRHCNHQVPLTTPVPDTKHWDYLAQLTEDDLVKNMLPIPKLDGGVYVIPQTDRLLAIVSNLIRMSSPIYDAVVPVWSLDSPQAIAEELQTTNLQPFVLTGVEPKHSSMIADIARGAVYSPRKLFLMLEPGVISPPQAVKLHTDMDRPELVNLESFKALPWENLGAQVVRKFMRGELNRALRGT